MSRQKFHWRIKTLNLHSILDSMMKMIIHRSITKMFIKIYFNDMIDISYDISVTDISMTKANSTFQCLK